MLRYLLVLLLPSVVLCNNPLIDFLRNFQNTPFSNGVEDLINGLTGSQERSLTLDPTEPPVEYYYSAWSEYSECTKICGGGIQKRKRHCLDQDGEQHPIIKCSKEDIMHIMVLINLVSSKNAMEEFEEKLCNKHECSVSSWTEPTSCSQKCGGGIMTYSRTCLEAQDQSMCNFESKMLKSCNTRPCFRLTPWGDWSQCTRKCGGGRASRSRKCEPNVENYSPLYNELKYALDHVSKTNNIRTIDNEDEAYYFSRYLKSCATQLVQTTVCNIQSCPKCPMNQVWYDCLPCKRMCKRINFFDLDNLDLDFGMDVSLPGTVRGCNGKCLPGCACPAFFPLLGQDNACYLMDLVCPQNRMTPMHGMNYLMYQLMLNKATTPSPTPQVVERGTDELSSGNETDDNSSVQPPIFSIDDENTSMIATTEEYSYTINYTTTASTNAPYTKPSCVYDKLIMDRNSCECRGGKAEVIECVGEPNIPCPMICTKEEEDEEEEKICPNRLMPRIKSSNECDTSPCQGDHQCFSGYKCCPLNCGPRCVYPIKPTD